VILIVLCQLVRSDTASSGPAIGQFELKDLDAEPGGIEFQSQNAHSWGQPRRRVLEETPGEFEYDDNSIIKERHALELEFGITRYFKTRIGIEYEKERLDDPISPEFADAFGDLVYSEFGFEGIVILVPPKDGSLGLGVVTEMELPREDGEANTIIMGPILQYAKGPWSALANLTFVHFFGGSEPTEDGILRDNKWDFAYAAQVMYEISTTWSLSLEGYGTIDRIGDSGTRSEEARLFGDHDQHRLGPIVYYKTQTDWQPRAFLSGHTAALSDDKDDETASLLVGLGLLFGLNDDTPDTTLKWTVEVEF
jgi:hypothetical protein